jgi:hypothetical protein
MPHERYDVYVIVPFALEGNTVSDTETQTDYVCATSADIGEIVAALQVLFPQMKGCSIEPFEIPELNNPHDG